jgi:hypothetical protein
LKTLHYIISVVCISIFSACATIVAPNGGPVDKLPPKVLEKNTQDSSVNFKGGKIVFEFDERIDESKIKVETFPLTKYSPKVSVNKRELTLSLPDSILEPNTTYKLSFGNSIVDIYEANPLGQLDFTFSTGAQLDTLELQGQVLQASNGLPDTAANILLYSSIEGDSDVQYKRPLYAKKVDANGCFKLSNLPDREFYIYAVADKNRNYVYDFMGERIAFINSSVLPLAKQVAPIKLYSFNETTDTSAATNTSAGRNTAKAAPSAPMRFSINIDSSDVKKRSFDITQPITLSFFNPISNWKNSAVRLYSNKMLDETGILSFDSVKNKIYLNVDLLQDSVYTLQLLDSFATDTAALKGASFTFRTMKTADYGSIVLQAGSNENTGKRIAYLFQNNSLIAQQEIKDSAANFTMLKPGNYSLNILNDANSNDKWDGGFYKKNKRMPEKVDAHSGEVLVKANWINKINFTPIPFKVAMDMNAALQAQKNAGGTTTPTPQAPRDNGGGR